MASLIYNHVFWFKKIFRPSTQLRLIKIVCHCVFRASEGKTVEVPYKGPVEVTVRDVLGGVRSTCTYVGAAKLKELSRRTTFIRVTQQLNTVFGNDN